MLQKINFDAINELQDSVNILDIVSAYIKLNKKGNSYFGICPFHPDTHPSLSVSPKKKLFKCFVCNAKGNVFNFVSKFEKITYFEAVKKIALKIGYDLTKLNIESATHKFKYNENDNRLVLANDRANNFYTGILYKEEYKDALNYIHKRNLNDEIIKKYQLGVAPNDSQIMIKWLTNSNNYFGEISQDKIFTLFELTQSGLIYHKDDDKYNSFLINRITFPIHDANDYLVGFSGRDYNNKSEIKYLHTASTPIFNKSNILYNFNRIKNINGEELIVVEGFLDLIAFDIAGFENCIATMGTALTNSHTNLLNSLSKLKKVILCFDNDQAGSIATTNVGKFLLEKGFNVFVANYSDHKQKDIDEILNNSGLEDVKKIINTRQDFIEYLILKTITKEIIKDKVVDSINEMIKYIVEHGNQLMHSQYLKQIASITGFDIDDLKQHLKKIVETQFLDHKPNTYEKKSYYVKNNSSFQSEVKAPIITATPLSYLEKTENNHFNMLKLLLKNNDNCLENLMYKSICEPKSVEAFYDKISFSESFFLNESLLIIIKQIILIYHSNNAITSLELVKKIKETLQTQSNENIIQVFDEKMKLMNHERQYYVSNLEEGLKELVKQISNNKYEILIHKTNVNLIRLTKQQPQDFKLKQKKYLNELETFKKQYNDFKKGSK